MTERTEEEYELAIECDRIEKAELKRPKEEEGGW